MPDLSAKPDVIPPDNQAGFGTSFPQNPDKGDMFLRVDMKPSRQYKFNGYNWMEMPKNDSYDYAFDEEYIKHLIKMVESGEYAIDDLSETEKEQMERFLTGNE
jgi:hypothetical protein